jgi:PAS domain S-box-containing protein
MGATGTTRDLLVMIEGAVLGAMVLNLTVMFQGMPSDMGLGGVQGFIVPTIVGGVVGLIVGYLFLRNGNARDALERLNEELDRKVRQRTSELRKANEDLKYEISERKLAQRTLERTLIVQKTILDNIPDMAWLKDKDGRFLAVNEAFEKASGVARETLMGKTDFDYWPEELAQRYRFDDEEVMKTGERKRIEETLVHAKDNQVWVETIKSPIADEQGRIVGTTGIARDITRRKLLELQLEQRQGQ